MALGLAVFLCLCGLSAGRPSSEYHAEQFVREVVSNLTLDQLIRQMELLPGWRVLGNQAGPSRLTTSGIGMVHDFKPPHNAKYLNDLQHKWMNYSGGIPIALLAECLTGPTYYGVTIMPQALALSAMWDQEVIGKVGANIGKEARGRGITVCLAPVLGTARDPRWGRVQEGYGEDVRHNSHMAKAIVEGMTKNGNLEDSEAVSSLAKHFVAYSDPESGINTAPARLGERELHENFLPAFSAAMKAGTDSVMCSYASLDGVPSCSNEELLEGWLRKKQNLGGYVISDLGAASGLYGSHRTAATPQDAMGQFVKAGGNQIFYDFTPDDWRSGLTNLTKDGTITRKLLEDRVADIVRLKHKLGLFTKPYIPPSLGKNVNTPEARALALEAAQKAITLLTNKKNALPLSPTAFSKIALVGPQIDTVRVGDYKGFGVLDNFVTLSQGVRAKVAMAAEAKGQEATAVSANWGAGVLNDWGQKEAGNPACQTDSVPIRSQFFKQQANGRVYAQYFNNTMWAGNPSYTAWEGEAYWDPYSWGVYNYHEDAPQSMNNTYTGKWEGVLIPEVTVHGCISFNGMNTKSEMAKLLLNGKEVINTFTDRHNPTHANFSFQANMEYTMELYYLRNGSTSAAGLQWALSGDGAMENAINAATEADAVIFATGDEHTIDTEGADRPRLTLTEPQEELLMNLRQATPASKPFICVLYNGRPMAIESMVEHCDAIVEGWYTGQASGTAMADVLFGDVNPAGRLPITFPREVGQLPMYYNSLVSKPVGKRHFYNDARPATSTLPLFAFGHGLSYTTFHYESIKATVGTNTIHVEVRVTNNGTRDGEEVVQLYYNQLVSQVEPPRLQLLQSQRLPFAKGETKDVSFTVIPSEEFPRWGLKKEWILEKGKYHLHAGGASDQLHLQANITLT